MVVFVATAGGDDNDAGSRGAGVDRSGGDAAATAATAGAGSSGSCASVTGGEGGGGATTVRPTRAIALSLAVGAETRRDTLRRHWARWPDAPPLSFWDAIPGDDVAAAAASADGRVALAAHGVHARALELGWAASHPTALAAALSHLAIWRALAATAVPARANPGASGDGDAAGKGDEAGEWWLILEVRRRVNGKERFL